MQNSLTKPASSNRQRTVVVPGRYGSLMSRGLVSLLALAFLAHHAVRSWQEVSEGIFVDILCPIALLALLIWYVAMHVNRLDMLIRKGYAIKLDAQGLHHYGLPAIPWDDIYEVSFDLIITMRDKEEPFLRLDLMNKSQRLMAKRAWWQLAGFGIKRRDEGRTILIPCTEIDGREPSGLVFLITEVMRVYQGRRA